MGRRYGGKKNRQHRGKKGPKPNKEDIDVLDLEEDDRRPNHQFEDDPAGSDYEVEDDEEIDEDMAFNSEDEEKYGEFFAKLKQRKGGSGGGGAVVDEDSDDFGEEEEDFEDEDEDMEEGMTLTDLFDLNQTGDGPKPQAAVAAKKKAQVNESGEGSEESGSEGGAYYSDDDEDVSSDEEALAGNHGALVEKMIALSGGKSEESESASRLLKERTEMLEESEFNAGAGDMKAGGVSVEELLSGLEGSRKLGKLKKQIDSLVTSNDKIAAPLPKTIQARADRKAQYQDTKGYVSRWQPQVQLNRRQKHLNFAREAVVQSGGKSSVTTAALVAKFQPENDLEKQVAMILEASGMEDKEIGEVEADDLQENQVSTAEMRKRKDELAKIQALMFYDEQKKRRQNKIKSKTYRKIKKKQRLKSQELEREKLREVDPEAARLLDEKDAMEAAKERVSLKKRTNSKWIRHALRQGGTRNEVFKDALNERNKQADDLRRLIASAKRDLDSDASELSESDEDDEDLHPLDKAKAEVLANVGLREKGGEYVELSDEEGEDHKGLFGMKFMRDAALRKRAEAREEAIKLAKELEMKKKQMEEGGSGGLADLLRDDSGESESEGDGFSKTESKNDEAQEQSSSGRRSFAGPKGKQQKSNGVDAETEREVTATLGEGFQVKELREGGGVTTKLSGSMHVALPSTASTAAAAAAAESDQDMGQAGEAWDSNAEANPWLNNDSLTAASRKRAADVAGKRGVKADEGEAGLMVDVHGGLKNLSKAVQRKMQAKAKSAGANGLVDAVRQAGAGAKFDSDSGSESDEGAESGLPEDGRISEAAVGQRPNQGVEDLKEAVAEAKGAKVKGNKKGKKSQAKGGVSEQEELIRRAFAGYGVDELEEEFEQEREEGIKSDHNLKEEDKRLAGWGTWAGFGAPSEETQRKRIERKTRKQPQQQKKKKTIAEKILEAKGQRRDGALKNVIISEKRDKKLALRYKVDTLPYPFTSREAYEKSIRMPLGGDWNTRETTETMTKPEILTRAGLMINPLKYTETASKEAKDAMRSKKSRLRQKKREKKGQQSNAPKRQRV